MTPVRDCPGCVTRTTLLLIAVWALNLADFALTTHVVGQGIASEGNRIMAYFLDAGLVPAFLFKMGVVTAGVVALWLLRRWRVTFVAATALTLVYAFVVAYQIGIVWRVEAL